jgi:sugar phosphate isomerase/epimerase
MKVPMPRFGILTNPFMNLTKEINEIHRLGFDYPEIGIEAPGGMPEIIIENKKKILSLLKKFPSPVIGHTGWMIDLGTLYDDIRKAWIEEGKRDILAASALGIKLINFHGIYHLTFFEDHGMKKQLLDNYVSSLKELVKFAKELEVDVMLENVPTNSPSAFKEYKYVIDSVKDLRVHFDVSHAFVNGGMKAVREFIRTFKGRIAHVHFSDSLGSDDHLPIGKGMIEYDKVVKLLKKIRYDKTITFEVFVDDRKEVVKSREKIKKMWKRV